MRLGCERVVKLNELCPNKRLSRRGPRKPDLPSVLWKFHSQSPVLFLLHQPVPVGRFIYSTKKTLIRVLITTVAFLTELKSAISLTIPYSLSGRTRARLHCQGEW